MSYLAFLLTFLVPPIAALLVLLRWRIERLSLDGAGAGGDRRPDLHGAVG